MDEKRVTAQAFHAADGVEDWRVLYGGAFAHFRTTSFAEAAKLVTAIADEAEQTGHFPDVDVRPKGVTVRTFTQPIGALSSVDITLARRISEVAAGMGLESDPSGLTVVNLAVAHDPDSPVNEFWAAALGYEEVDGDAIDPNRRNPSAAFHPFSHPDRGAAVCTSMSASPPMRQRGESKRLSPPVDAWSRVTRGRRSGGLCDLLTTMGSTSRHGRTPRTSAKRNDANVAVAVPGTWPARYRRSESRLTTLGLRPDRGTDRDT